MDYEHEGVVSIWIGTISTESPIDEFLEEQYNEDGDAACPLWTTLGIDWFDHDFQEMHWQPTAATAADLLAGHSYAESFVKVAIAACNDLNITSGNAVLLLYDFAYEGSNRKLPVGLTFVGSFPYSKR